MGTWSWRRPGAPKTGRGPEMGVDPVRRDRLEEELVAQFRAQRAGRTRGTMMNRYGMRWVALGLVLALGIAACATPTTTEVTMGERVTFTIPADGNDWDAADALFAQTRDVVEAIRARPGVDDVSVSVNEVEGGPVTLDLMVWGRDLEFSGLVRELAASHGVLAKADVTRTPLTGEIHESFAKKFGREVLSLELDDGTAEEMRADILAQLAEQGWGEGAEVTVQRDGGQTTIGVTLEGDGMQTEQVIEFIGEGVPESIEIGGDPAELDADGDGEVEVRRVVEKSSGGGD